MGTLQEEITFLQGAGARITNNISGVFYEEVRSIMSMVKASSPVDTGEYQKSWAVKRERGTAAIASATLYNPATHASALDIGIKPGSNHPWDIAHKRGTGPGIVKSKGMLWSAKAPGGVLSTTVSLSYTQVMAQKIADAAIGVFR